MNLESMQPTRTDRQTVVLFHLSYTLRTIIKRNGNIVTRYVSRKQCNMVLKQYVYKFVCTRNIVYAVL